MFKVNNEDTTTKFRNSERNSGKRLKFFKNEILQEEFDLNLFSKF